MGTRSSIEIMNERLHRYEIEMKSGDRPRQVWEIRHHYLGLDEYWCTVNVDYNAFKLIVNDEKRYEADAVKAEARAMLRCRSIAMSRVRLIRPQTPKGTLTCHFVETVGDINKPKNKRKKKNEDKRQNH